MSKVYFCKKFLPEGIQCGETNPDLFPKGRYSECKECKNRYTREYFKSLKPSETTSSRSQMIHTEITNSNDNLNIIKDLYSKIDLLFIQIETLHKENKMFHDEIERLKLQNHKD